MENKEKCYFVSLDRKCPVGFDLYVLDDEGLAKLIEIESKSSLGGIDSLKKIECPRGYEKEGDMAERVLLRYPLYEPNSAGLTRLGEKCYTHLSFDTKDKERVLEAIDRRVDFLKKYS